MTSSTGHCSSTVMERGVGGVSGGGGSASGPSSGTFTTTTLSMENCSLAAATSLCELANSVKERHGMWIFGETESKRRVIIIEKKNGSYGFTLQSYGVRYKAEPRKATDFITYVNAVEKDGAAYEAGLREGDVILSINGQNMARVEHKSLVNYIRKCPMHLKMVVVSDERARKVELHMRYVHLQKKLNDKMRELEDLQRKEHAILAGESESLIRRSNSPSPNPIAGPCIAAAAKVCCFCPPSKAEKLEAKEKSKSIGSTAERFIHKENLMYYDCYRKSQSTRELHKEQNSSMGKLSTKEKASSGGDIITLSSSSNNNVLSSSSMTKVNSNSNTNTSTITTTNSSTAAAASAAAAQHLQIQIQSQHRPGCYHHHYSHNHNHNRSGMSSPSSQAPPTTSSSGGQPPSSSSGYASDSAQKYASNSNSKPKSWDNLMGTKSFGGYGFGFGYGYFPQRAPGQSGGEGSGGHYHFTHPHHHNHHTHCSNHVHSNYYFKQKGQNQNSQNPSTSGGGGGGGGGSGGGSGGNQVPMSGTGRYHAYPPRGPISSAIVRTSYGMSSTSPIPPDGGSINNASNCKTLPNLKSSASRTSESSSGISPRMEKTLSDSSLNSEHHKDFPKAMSYFRASENEDAHYSSEDEYDQYATESSYEGKRIFV